MNETDDGLEELVDVPTTVNLILVGRSGAGKSTTANGLATLTRRPVIEIGHFVRKDAAEEGRAPLEKAQQTFEAGEYTYFVRRAVVEARRRGIPCIIVGARMPVELDFLRRELRPTLSIGLLLPDMERRIRLALRPDNLDYSEQVKRDDTEEKWGIARTLETCDSHVYTVPDPRAVVADCLHEWLRADSEWGSRR